MSGDRFQVTGMTCGHCEASVREEVGAIAGVHTVDVDAQTGALVVHADTQIADADVITAVAEAGYSAVRAG